MPSVRDRRRRIGDLNLICYILNTGYTVDIVEVQRILKNCAPNDKELSRGGVSQKASKK